MTAASYDELLRAEGYVPGLPRAISRIWAAEDRALCAGEPCAACHHQGLRYAPYTTADRRGYRALCVCPSCGEAAEF